MSVIMLEILFIFGLILINGVFALTEIAIVASRKSRLQRLADKGSRPAAVALRLVESPADFLSTVQVGITLVGVLSGAFAGATIAEQLAYWLGNYPAFAPYAETIAIGAVVVVITYLSLILGELVPKRIALGNPERIGSFMSRPMWLLSKVTLPAVRMLSLSTDAVLWLLRVKPSGEPSITEDEVRMIVRQGTIAGGFERTKQEMIERVFRLASLRLPAIMTHRKDVVILFTTDTLDVVTEKVKQGRYSHYPLCDGSLDNVVGIVSTRDLLLAALGGRGVDLRSCARDVPSIPESASALKALGAMRSSESPVALVIDEFGGLQGILTMNDFAGAIVGAHPGVETPTIVTRKDGSLLVDGILPIGDLLEAIRLPQLTIEELHGFSTVGGFVAARLGRIPSTGDVFEFGGYGITVLEMDGHRVGKVLLSRKKSTPS